MSRSEKTILCIDDHQKAVSGWCLYLQGEGYSAVSASNPEEGLQLFATRPIDAVILDYAMPEMNGAEVAAAMKRIKPGVPVILFTAYSNLPESVTRGVDAFVVKGQSPGVLLQKLGELLGE